MFGPKIVTLEVLLADKPVKDIEKLKVDISSFSYHYAIADEGVWATPTNVSTSVDILSLAGTEVSWLKINLPENATLTQIRFEVESATVTVAGVENSVILPNKTVHLPKVDISAVDGELVLDFDLVRSLHYNGNKYILTPVLKPTFRRGNVFSIKGTAVEASLPLKHAVVALFPTDESTILRLTLTRKDGSFYLGKWKNGTYVVKIFKNLELPDESEDLVLPTENVSRTVTIEGKDVTVDFNF